jgi:fructose-specific phosphotransferase system component IIB
MITDKSKIKNAEQSQFIKTIGKTVYKVNIHFSIKSKETIIEKIMRLLANETQQNNDI